MSRILVDTSEFQSKVLDCIKNGELDKIYQATVFKDNPECRGAMMHGMIMASMLILQCNLVFMDDETGEDKAEISRIAADVQLGMRHLEYVMTVLHDELLDKLKDVTLLKIDMCGRD